MSSASVETFHCYHIMVLGLAGAGKTKFCEAMQSWSLWQRAHEWHYKPTTAHTTYEWTEAPYRLRLTDTTTKLSISEKIFSEQNLFIVLFDPYTVDAPQKLQKLHDFLIQHQTNEIVFFVETKCDIGRRNPKQRTVSEAVLKSFALQHFMIYLGACSAKDNENITGIAKALIEFKLSDFKIIPEPFQAQQKALIASPPQPPIHYPPPPLPHPIKVNTPSSRSPKFFLTAAKIVSPLLLAIGAGLLLTGVPGALIVLAVGAGFFVGLCLYYLHRVATHGCQTEDLSPVPDFSYPNAHPFS